MLNALKRWLARRPADALSLREIADTFRATAPVLRDEVRYGPGPAMRLYLNQSSGRYQDPNGSGIEGWR